VTPSLATNQHFSWQKYTSAIRKADGHFICSLPENPSFPTQETAGRATVDHEKAEQAANMSPTTPEVAEGATPSETAAPSSRATPFPHYINSHARGLLRKIGKAQHTEQKDLNRAAFFYETHDDPLVNAERRANSAMLVDFARNLTENKVLAPGTEPSMQEDAAGELCNFCLALVALAIVSPTQAQHQDPTGLASRHFGFEANPCHCCSGVCLPQSFMCFNFAASAYTHASYAHSHLLSSFSCGVLVAHLQAAVSYASYGLDHAVNRT
jgi:hypothetical protein